MECNICNENKDENSFVKCKCCSESICSECAINWHKSKGSYSCPLCRKENYFDIENSPMGTFVQPQAFEQPRESVSTEQSEQEDNNLSRLILAVLIFILGFFSTIFLLGFISTVFILNDLSITISEPVEYILSILFLRGLMLLLILALVVMVVMIVFNIIKKKCNIY